MFVLACGLTMALYLIRDRRDGLLAQLPVHLRPVISWIYIFSGTLVCGQLHLPVWSFQVRLQAGRENVCGWCC